jgi:hypothetical protein
MQIFKIWSIFNVNSKSVTQTGLIQDYHRLHGYAGPTLWGSQKLVVIQVLHQNMLYKNLYITLSAISDSGLHVGRTAKFIFYLDHNCLQLASPTSTKSLVTKIISIL